MRKFFLVAAFFFTFFPFVAARADTCCIYYQGNGPNNICRRIEGDEFVSCELVNEGGAYPTNLVGGYRTERDDCVNNIEGVTAYKTSQAPLCIKAISVNEMDVSGYEKNTYYCICGEKKECRRFDTVEKKCTSDCEGGPLASCPAAASTTTATSAGSSGNGDCPEGSVCLTNPLSGNPTTVPAVLGRVIKAGMGIIGALALLMFVYGGFQWLISAGNAEKVKTGTQTMLWAAIGVILVFSSYLLLDTFIDYLTGKV